MRPSGESQYDDPDTPNGSGKNSGDVDSSGNKPGEPDKSTDANDASPAKQPDNKTDGASALKDAKNETESDKEDSKKRSKLRTWFNNHKKRVVAGGIAAVLLGGGGFMAAPVLEMGVIHQEASIFKRFFGKNDHDSSTRLKELFRWARASKTGSVAESRVGIIGSKYFNAALDDLAKIGITIEPTPNGSPGKFIIDTEKMKTAFPEMEGMDRVQQEEFLRDKFGLTGNAANNLSATEFNDAAKTGKFAIDTRTLGLKATRATALKGLGLLNDGWIDSAMKTRFLTKALNLPSLFHPMNRAKAALSNRISGSVDLKKERRQAEQAREKALTDPEIAESKPDVDAIKGKTTGITGTIIKATTLTGIACVVYSVADNIVNVNHERIVMTSEARATDVMAVDSQWENGGDSFDPSQPGEVAHAQIDKNGKGIADSAAWNAASHDGTYRGGYQMNTVYKGAFSGDTTAANIRSGVDKAMGGSAGVLCSKPGILAQILVTVGAAILTDGSSITLQTIGKVALEQGINFVVAGVAMHFITDFILNENTAAQLKAEDFQGPIGGELLTYGARAAANTAGVAGGGIALGNNTSTMYANEVAAAQHEEFEHRNVFARVFDPGERESLAGHLAMALTPALSGGITAMANNAASGILNIGHSLSSAFSLFLPKVGASAPFDWGFPQYGIPETMLADPNLSNPYDNATRVVDLLNTNPDPYVSRAATCFGVDINNNNPLQLWDVFPTKDVNTSSQEYTDAHCNDLSDYNWKRVIMFTFDTQTMKAVACYQGDNDACSEVAGNGPANAALTATGGTTGSGSTTLPTGDTITLAKAIAAKPNVISFQTKQDYDYFQQIIQTGHATDCGAPQISPKLLGVILTLSESYKLVLGVFDDGHGCDSGFHPKGEAVDINGVNPLNGGPGGTGNQLHFTPDSMAIIKQFYQSAGEVLAANGGGGLGQYSTQCFGSPLPPKVSGVVYFPDACTHIHLDVGQR